MFYTAMAQVRGNSGVTAILGSRQYWGHFGDPEKGELHGLADYH